MFQCIESYVSKLKSENAILVEKVTRLDAEVNRLQIQLNAVTEERDSFKTKVCVLGAWFSAFFDGSSGYSLSAVVLFWWSSIQCFDAVAKLTGMAADCKNIYHFLSKVFFQNK